MACEVKSSRGLGRWQTRLLGLPPWHDLGQVTASLLLAFVPSSHPIGFNEMCFSKTKLKTKKKKREEKGKEERAPVNWMTVNSVNLQHGGTLMKVRRG